jgi:glycolate oxidase iron-sulfur subunit
MTGSWRHEADGGLAALADQCVKCGLCLPHCPTYRVAGNEAESPRGRIAIARAIAVGDLAPEPVAMQHLDQCLACLSCEVVCPAHVRYEDIIVRIRARLASRRRAPDWLARLARSPRWLTRLARLGRALHAHAWLPRLARVFPSDSRWRALLHETPQLRAEPLPIGSYRESGVRVKEASRLPPLAQASAPPPSRERVALFRGCVASVFDRDTHEAARILLEALDYEVVTPRPAHCCGALARHAGAVDAADSQAAGARDGLLATGAERVLVSASGCLGEVRTRVAGPTALRVDDVLGFLAADSGFASLRFRALPKRVALHVPCTQVSAGPGAGPARALLSCIPGLIVLELPLQPRCCGAAGSYFLEHPEIAGELRAQKVAQFDELEADLLLTGNVGCRMYLDNALARHEPRVRVLHPLILLAQQLETPE